MIRPKLPRRRPISRGVTMIEILIALVITVFGLFALLAFNLRTYQAESESYQRSQALVLVEDMAQRIRANRSAILDYATPDTAAAGAGAGLETCGAGVSAANDICEWGNLLRGAAETAAGGIQIGAMSHAQGCIAVTAPAPGASGPTSANVVVVWRGNVATETNAAAPCVPAGFNVTDGFMRFTSTIVRLGDLDGV